MNGNVVQVNLPGDMHSSFTIIQNDRTVPLPRASPLDWESIKSCLNRPNHKSSGCNDLGTPRPWLWMLWMHTRPRPDSPCEAPHNSAPSHLEYLDHLEQADLASSAHGPSTRPAGRQPAAHPLETGAPLGKGPEQVCGEHLCHGSSRHAEANPGTSHPLPLLGGPLRKSGGIAFLVAVTCK